MALNSPMPFAIVMRPRPSPDKSEFGFSLYEKDRTSEMPSIFTCVLTLNGAGYPFVALLVFLAAVLYQLVSGTLLKFWGTSTTREDRPAVYWIVLAIELVLVLVGLYLGTL